MALRAGVTGEPRLLLLDEPTNGLDAEGLDALASLINHRATAGQTTLLVTHDEACGARFDARRYRLRGGTIARCP